MASEPIEQAMETLRWRRREAEAQLARVRGADPRSHFPTARDVERFLEVRDELRPALAAAVAAHLARGAAEAELAPARRALRESWAEPIGIERAETRVRRALAELWMGPQRPRAEAVLAAIEPRVRRDVERLIRARAQATRAAATLWAQLGTERHPDAGPLPDARRESAAEVLRHTDDLLGAALEVLGDPGSLAELTQALRWREGDRDAPTRDRYRRLGRTWGALEPVLSRTVRVDAEHDEPRVDPHVVVLDARRDVRILPSPFEMGWQSERGAARAVGRALAHSLAAPPLAFARPTAQTISRAFGELGVDVWADEARASRDGIARREAATRRRLSAARTVLELRIHAVSVEIGFVAPRTGGWDDRGEDMDGVAETLLRRAVGVAVPGPLARLMIHTPSGGGARLRGALGGLRLWVGLRERFDADWYRNPHAEETLRALAAPGGGASIEEACAELAEPDAWLERLQELVGR